MTIGIQSQIQKLLTPAAFRVALCLSFLIISYLATAPLSASGLPGGDKAGHFMAFYALALMLDFSFPNKSCWSVGKLLPLLAYGFLIEAVQYFLPYRDFSSRDFLADGAGILAYCVSVPLFKQIPVLNERWSAPMRQ